jgi:5-(hydroxymethyl)furfural/furfural oxidase
MNTAATDYLIIGGGSAGCVLAARLTESPQVNVVLVEAGEDLAHGAVPDEIGSGYPSKPMLMPRFIWSSLTAFTGGTGRNDPAARPRPRYEQARVLGGGSSVNAMVAYRGAPGDYDEWGEMGAEGWTWETTLPYFRKLETDQDFDNEFHGQSGPIPVRRMPQSSWTAMTHATVAALKSRGVDYHPDMNGAWEDGAFPTATTQDRNGKRAPTALMYLSREVRARPNLRIISATSADRLVFEGNRVAGADLRGPGGPQTLLAKETIVSCGGIHAPALLLRSGIGPQTEIARHGIAVQRHLPGVGANLMEHPSSTLAIWLNQSARMTTATMHHIFLTWRWSSGVENCHPGDMHVAFPARSTWHPLGAAIGIALLCIYKPYSRGRVTLASADPTRSPDVDLQLLADWRDRTRLKLAYRTVAEVLLSPELDGVRSLTFPAVFSDRVKRVSAVTRGNAIRTALIRTALDAAGPFRAQLIHGAITEGITLQGLLQDDAMLDTFIDQRVGVTWHPSGTCRMGRAEDPMAVTDNSGRVHGVPGLRVCDASIMPCIPRANTNLPTIMVAERVADLIKAQN